MTLISKYFVFSKLTQAYVVIRMPLRLGAVPWSLRSCCVKDFRGESSKCFTLGGFGTIEIEVTDKFVATLEASLCRHYWCPWRDLNPHSLARNRF